VPGSSCPIEVAPLAGAAPAPSSKPAAQMQTTARSPRFPLATTHMEHRRATAWLEYLEGAWANGPGQIAYAPVNAGTIAWSFTSVSASSASGSESATMPFPA
jgi:hypothetical protein